MAADNEAYQEQEVLFSIVAGPNSTARAVKTTGKITIEIHSIELFSPEDAIVLALVRSSQPVAS